jgi:uncharacterized DUF497 family protein
VPWVDFVWTDDAIEKIARHDITTDDVDFVIQNPAYTDMGESSGRDLAFGYTETGEWIACAFEMVDKITAMPITAYTPTKGR